MKKNRGSTDRIIRIIVAVIIAVLFFTNLISGTLGIVLLIFAGIFVFDRHNRFLSALHTFRH